HEFLYWEFHEGGFKQAVRSGDWKAVRLRPGGPPELYDLRADPGETRDLAADHPEVVARVETYLKTARVDSPDFPVRGPEPPHLRVRGPEAAKRPANCPHRSTHGRASGVMC